MGTSATSSPIGASATERTPSAYVADASARPQRQKPQETLIRLVEQSSASGDKGQHVNYYG